MNHEYILRLYDTDMLAFTLTEQGIEGLKAHILWINEEKRHLLPIDMQETDAGVLKWLQKRVIPKNRTYVSEILKTFGLSINDTKGIIDICKGLSLNDSYWVVHKGFEGKFAQYNLYENRFSEILSLVAYTGIGQSDAAFTTSPELTTNGMLPKAWRFISGDGIYLYKGGTFGAANTGNEPYSKTLGAAAYEQIKSMLVFDAVIYNEDRHFGNFGVLRDQHSGEIIGAAPIFDNGLSLFNFAMPDDFKDLERYAKTRGTAYGVSFESVCQEVMGPVQARQLRRLIGFTFRRHPKLNLPEYRLQAIEKHIQVRVQQLLRLQPEHKKEPVKHDGPER